MEKRLAEEKDLRHKKEVLPQGGTSAPKGHSGSLDNADRKDEKKALIDSVGGRKA